MACDVEKQDESAIYLFIYLFIWGGDRGSTVVKVLC